jgi:methionyl-tRNA synthetase
LNFRGGKFNKSRGAAVDVPYFLNKYDPDPLRYYLAATAPETRDTEFFWEDFVERDNNELIATWGNLGNRMLSFAYKRFQAFLHRHSSGRKQFPTESLGLFQQIRGAINRARHSDDNSTRSFTGYILFSAIEGRPWPEFQTWWLAPPCAQTPC